MRHAEHPARNRTSLAGLEQNLLFFGPPHITFILFLFKAERLAAYKEKKAKKPALIAKSNVILDIKPWDDETDLVELERLIRW